MAAQVLVIEDHRDSLELLRYLLTACGHTPLLAGDGERGLALAAAERPDLVLCDLQLPGIDGFEVARRLRAQPATANLRLWAVTAFARASDRERALAAGFDGHISKPIEPEQFLDQLASILATERPP